MNGTNEVCKRKEVCEIFASRNFNVLGVREKHLKGCVFFDSKNEDGKELRKIVAGGVIWAGIGKARKKDVCAILVSPRVWAGKDGLG